MVIIESYLVYIAIGAAALALTALFWVISFEWRLKKLFCGSAEKDLQGVLVGLRRDADKLRGDVSEIQKYLEAAEPRIAASVKHVGVVRFDSYGDVGGNQSFAAAFMDERKNGVVFSSLYGRETNRVYAKPLVGGVSQFTLSDEEKEAIAQALKEQFF